jgi:hypothetical protein
LVDHGSPSITTAITVVMMVQRRWQAGAWFQLLLSYLSQCDAVQREDHHSRVEETRFRGDRGLVGLQSGFSAAAREAEDARGWSQLRRLKWHVIDGD